MIDSVYKTVLTIVNKNNYGYINPTDFNLFARTAQLELFENMFYDYNNRINLENLRKSGTGYADILKGIQEDINLFSKTVQPVWDGASAFNLPSDYYLLNKVMGVSGGVRYEAEAVSHSKITMLINSILTAPTTEFPAYVTDGSKLTVYPTTYNTTTELEIQYIRYPKDPKWTYFNALSNQAPLFDATASDYQDFELPKDYFNDLVMKICQYAGVEIRDEMIYKFGKTEEQETNAEQR